MTRDHLVGAVGAGSAYAWAATVIAGLQGCSSDMANAEAGLLLLGLGALWQLAARLLPPTPAPSPAAQ
jgi:hypothetical protein